MASMVLSRPQTQIKTRTKRDGKEREQHQHAVSMNDSQDTTNTLSGTFNLAQAMQSSGRASESQAIGATAACPGRNAKSTTRRKESGAPLPLLTGIAMLRRMNRGRAALAVSCWDDAESRPK
mmetsp:Transcript_5264/g.9485  ORF Transcript_5264/g.9485 Transcript_5264/m.9485 type:complete len:122 (+) Transcript_5264:504-869(+)